MHDIVSSPQSKTIHYSRNIVQQTSRVMTLVIILWVILLFSHICITAVSSVLKLFLQQIRQNKNHLCWRHFIFWSITLYLVMNFRCCSLSQNTWHSKGYHKQQQLTSLYYWNTAYFLLHLCRPARLEP